MLSFPQRGGELLTAQQALTQHETKQVDLFHERPTYVGVEANWTRFMNDDVNRPNSNNLSCTTYAKRFGRARVFYAKSAIKAHTELTWSYGLRFWKSRPEYLEQKNRDTDVTQQRKAQPGPPEPKVWCTSADVKDFYFSGGAVHME
jgi:hypothetical protein